MTWDFHGRKVVMNSSAVLQPGVVGSGVIDDVLRLSCVGEASTGMLILTVEFDELVGPDPITAVERRSDVRYGFDPCSKAKTRNRRPVPMVFQSQPEDQDEATVYLVSISKTLHLVRAHFGAPYPPPPFASSAKNWVGHEHIMPGRKGCLDFWMDHALITYDRHFFDNCSTKRPDWL